MPGVFEQFGPLDIYLFDQLLKGRVTPGMRVFDAGCGSGRNIVYFLRESYSVFGADADPEAISYVRGMAASLAPRLPSENFRLEQLESMSFPAWFADLVISCAVLHFAADDAQFQAMLAGTWRVVKPGGLLFCRLASTIGMEREVERIEGRRFRLPDGSDRYLVDETLLMQLTHDMGGMLEDPLKTTVVQGQRSMTTWVLRKQA